MEIEEWTRTLEQVAREREALNASYAELQEEARRGAEEVAATGIKRPQEEVIPEMFQLLVRFGNYVTIEREHADKLFQLLVAALERLAECYEIELPPGWPNPQEPR